VIELYRLAWLKAHAVQGALVRLVDQVGRPLARLRHRLLRRGSGDRAPRSSSRGRLRRVLEQRLLRFRHCTLDTSQLSRPKLPERARGERPHGKNQQQRS
jgi:hypothetical protein